MSCSYIRHLGYLVPYVLFILLCVVFKILNFYSTVNNFELFYFVYFLFSLFFIFLYLKNKSIGFVGVYMSYFLSSVVVYSIFSFYGFNKNISIYDIFLKIQVDYILLGFIFLNIFLLISKMTMKRFLKNS